MFKLAKKMEKILAKEERFKRVASKILNKLRLLKEGANSNDYSYSGEPVNKIIYTVDAEWKIVKSEFNTMTPKRGGFIL